MRMKKQFLIIFILLISMLTIAGCTTKDDIQNEGQLQNKQKEDDVTQPARIQNFEEVNLKDLAIGQKISVTGTENSDGSVSADQIMIGNSKADFKRMAGLMQPINGDNEQVEDDGSQTGETTSNANEDRPNFEQMQNMSEEERVKFREEMKARREAGGRNSPRANMAGGMTRLNGEIINIDDSTITLKIEEDGSKLVFYSDETKVLRFKEDNIEAKEEVIE